jgi:nucleoside-diphosphate-sugar epimerase
MIVRAADLYGPNAILSLTHATVFERLRAGKTPQWVGNAKAVHTFTFTPDAGRSVALLGNTPSAYGQVCHALTSKEAITGEEFVRLACELAGKPFKLHVAPGWMLALMGLFVHVLRENREMMYQFEQDYRFESSTLEWALNVQASDYRSGIKVALAT